MPELPEVEIVRQGLEKILTGQTFRHVETRRSGLRYPFQPLFSEQLAGQVLYKLERRGRYLLGQIGNAHILVMHLGMSGHFHELLPQDMPAKHDHVIFHLANGKRLAFHDPRRFSFMEIIAQKTLFEHHFFKNLGLEPLSIMLTPEWAIKWFQKRSVPIKQALLDQRAIAGLGNIYVCESLWRAGISPFQSAQSLTFENWQKLIPIIQEILQEAILAGGSSLKDHRQINGESGQFQNAFNVYNRQDQPCFTPICSATISRVIQGGRSTYYCPSCQPHAYSRRIPY